MRAKMFHKSIAFVFFWQVIIITIGYLDYGFEDYFDLDYLPDESTEKYMRKILFDGEDFFLIFKNKIDIFAGVS